MGAPADNGPDRDAAPERETPVDEAWTKGTSMHNDQTTAGLQVDAASVEVAVDHDRTATGLDPELVAASGNHDQTVVAPYAEQKERPPTDGSSAALDATIAELGRANAVPDHDRTRAGMGIEPVRPRAGVVLLQPGKGKVPLEKERVLAQPERSPLDLVMRDLEPAAPARAHASGDSSRFVAALVGDQLPPRIEAEPVDLSALRPVARRSGRRSTWIAAGAFAAIAVLGTAAALTLTGAGETPAAAAGEVAKVSETPAAVAAAEPVPTPSTVAAPSADRREVAAAADPGQASVPTVPAEVPAPPEATEQPSEAAPMPARTTVVVATASEPAATSATPKRSSLAKTSKADSAATKKPSAAKAVAKTPAPAKKATAAKTTTAKKPTATKTAAKKPTVAKKSTTKKTSTSKSSRAQPNGRRPRRS